MVNTFLVHCPVAVGNSHFEKSLLQNFNAQFGHKKGTETSVKITQALFNN